MLSSSSGHYLRLQSQGGGGGCQRRLDQFQWELLFFPRKFILSIGNIRITTKTRPTQQETKIRRCRNSAAECLEWNTKNKYYPATRWEAPTHWAQSSHRCSPAAKVLISPQKKVPTLRFRGNLGNMTKDKLDENINDKSGRCKSYLGQWYAEHKKRKKLNTHFGKLKIAMAHYQSSTGWCWVSR